MNHFELAPANDFIWNQTEFTQFLIDNQYKSIYLNTHHEGVCLKSAGIYDLLEQFGYSDVTIKTNNLLEQHPQYKILLDDPFKFFQVEHGNYQDLHHWTQRKIFGCFYNRPVWYRIGLAATLQHDNHSALINLRAPFDTEDSRGLVEVQQLFNYAPDAFAKFAQVFVNWPCQLEDQDGYTVGNTTTGHTDQMAKFYADILIDIVAETWCSGNTFFPTEKTVRPMLLKKPFIVMGPADYLCYLRQMGFRTFGDFWPEDYDGYEIKTRFEKILQLIDSLAKKTINELESMYLDMQYTLDHNYNLLVEQRYTTQIKHVE